MVLENVVVRSKLDTSDAPQVLSFEVMKEDEVIEVRIPGGASRNEMVGQVLDLEIGERIDIYAFVRDWNYNEDGEAKTKSVYYVRGITHYGP